MLKDNIKAARANADMTLDEVARRVGVSRQTIQRYESGVIQNIPSNNIEKMADAFGVSPEALMGWGSDALVQNVTTTLTPPERAHIEKYRAITDEHRATVDHQLDFFYEMDTSAKPALPVPTVRGAWEPKFTARDEREIDRAFDHMDMAEAAFGEITDPEALKESLKPFLRRAKMNAKRKYTPKKHRNTDNNEE